MFLHKCTQTFGLLEAGWQSCGETFSDVIRTQIKMFWSMINRRLQQWAYFVNERNVAYLEWILPPTKRIFSDGCVKAGHFLYDSGHNMGYFLYRVKRIKRFVGLSMGHICLSHHIAIYACPIPRDSHYNISMQYNSIIKFMKV